MSDVVVAVLCGGTSAEREVSLGSGQACALALARTFPTQFFEINADALPAGLDAEKHVVFSALHGGFGENGGMQALLDAAGIHYAGCDSASCALTIDKSRTKHTVAARGVRVAGGLQFSAARRPTAEEIVARLGEDVVIKPNDEGSSVGLVLARSRAEISSALAAIDKGQWLAEQRIAGRELSVGILDGRAMGVVEIRPKSGVYDYASKYTKGMTEYFAPAPLDARTTEAVRGAAETAFAACGGRDYGRVDFILSAQNEPVFLEINPLPGMKETSLLPKSASCVGLDFVALLRRMVEPAIARQQAASKRFSAASSHA